MRCWSRAPVPGLTRTPVSTRHEAQARIPRGRFSNWTGSAAAALRHSRQARPLVGREHAEDEYGRPGPVSPASSPVAVTAASAWPLEGRAWTVTSTPTLAGGPVRSMASDIGAPAGTYNMARWLGAVFGVAVLVAVAVAAKIEVPAGRQGASSN
jgi:hypothetical protein